jgi:hypothetical protein
MSAAGSVFSPVLILGDLAAAIAVKAICTLVRELWRLYW